MPTYVIPYFLKGFSINGLPYPAKPFIFVIINPTIILLIIPPVFIVPTIIMSVISVFILPAVPIFPYIYGFYTTVVFPFFIAIPMTPIMLILIRAFPLIIPIIFIITPRVLFASSIKETKNGFKKVLIRVCISISCKC